MAIKFKSSVNGADAINQKLKALRAPLQQKDYKEIGRRIVKSMKSLISKGLSPIRGGGFSKRFPKYKRQDDPRGYPATVKSKYRTKKQRPVNLKLSGKFLDALSYKANSFGVTIGYFKNSEAKKEEGHRKGANTQPKRPTIPDASNRELFTATIQDEYLKVANSRVSQIARKKN